VTGPDVATLFEGAYDAILFDLDGVLTSTAALHEDAWRSMFDEFLQQRTEEFDEPFVGFDSGDYVRFVDGKPRFDGVRSFLESRGIELPEGEVDAEPSAESVTGLGNRKQQIFLHLLDTDGVDLLPGSVDFVSAAQARGMRTAVVSSSANAERVLDAARLTGSFDPVVDGLVARRLGLAGKPAPDTFLEAARLLEVAPERAVVVEDALAGVAAGKAGGFGLVIGVGPPEAAAGLAGHGADLVVGDLTELLPDHRRDHRGQR
jgi:beta-phosphoglucomutase family hydrolase